jgi:glucokinase
MDHLVREVRDNDHIYFVGVDIGGTNTRVALATIDPDGVSTDTHVYSVIACSSVSVLIEELNKVSEQLKELIGNSSAGGCLAVAGRIIKDGQAVEFTNYDKNSNLLNKNELPTFLFPHNNTHFLNDLESSCYGLIGLDERHKLQKYFEVFWSSQKIENIRLQPQRYLVFAMGTGLGIALLITTKNSHKHEVLSLEFGHILHAGLGAMDEDATDDKKLLRHLSNKLYQNQYVPETEDICSGRGLKYVYDWVREENQKNGCEVPDLETPKDIATEAINGNLYATKAMLFHFKWLFRSAQNLCVGLQAQGVFLAGDNQVNNHPFVMKYKSRLREVFLNHPKQAWIENIPFFSQTEKLNTNIEGTIYYAQRHFALSQRQ